MRCPRTGTNLCGDEENLFIRSEMIYYPCGFTCNKQIKSAQAVWK